MKNTDLALEKVGTNNNTEIQNSIIPKENKNISEPKKPTLLYRLAIIFIILPIVGYAFSLNMEEQGNIVMYLLGIAGVIYLVIVTILNYKYVKAYKDYLNYQLENIKDNNINSVKYLKKVRADLLNDILKLQDEVNNVSNIYFFKLFNFDKEPNPIRNIEHKIAAIKENIEEALKYDEKYPQLYKELKTISIQHFKTQDNNADITITNLELDQIKIIEEFLSNFDDVYDLFISRPWYNIDLNMTYNIDDIGYFVNKFYDNITLIYSFTNLNLLLDNYERKFQPIDIKDKELSGIDKILVGVDFVAEKLEYIFDILLKVNALSEKYPFSNDFENYIDDITETRLKAIIDGIIDFYNNHSKTKSFEPLKKRIENYLKTIEELENFITKLASLIKEIEEHNILNFTLTLDLVKNIDAYLDTFSMVNKYNEYLDINAISWEEFKKLVQYKRLLETKFQNIETNKNFLRQKERDIKNMIDLVSTIGVSLEEFALDEISGDISMAKKKILFDKNNLERLHRQVERIFNKLVNDISNGKKVPVKLVVGSVPSDLINYTGRLYNQLLSATDIFRVRSILRDILSELKRYIDNTKSILSKIELAENNIKEMRKLKNIRLAEKIEDLNNRFVQLSSIIDTIGVYNATDVDTFIKYFDDIEKQILSISFPSYYNTINSIISQYGGVSGIKELLNKSKKSLEYIIDLAKS